MKISSLVLVTPNQVLRGPVEDGLLVLHLAKSKGSFAVVEVEAAVDVVNALGKPDAAISFELANGLNSGRNIGRFHAKSANLITLFIVDSFAIFQGDSAIFNKSGNNLFDGVGVHSIHFGNPFLLLWFYYSIFKIKLQ